MMSRSALEVLSPVSLAVVFLLCIGLAPTTHAATTPDVKCGKTVGKSMSTCVKKIIGAHTKCYKKTDAACVFDAKIPKTYESTKKKIEKACFDEPTIVAAGYGTYDVSDLSDHMNEVCARISEVAVERSFSADGSAYTGADEAGKKCLQKVGKEAAKIISKGAKILSKCAGGACVGADVSEDILKVSTKGAAKLDKSCTDLNALIGWTPVAFSDAAADQIPSSVASPCDLLDETRCLFPFPNDYFSLVDDGTSSGRRLALSSSSFPDNVEGDQVDPAPWNHADGFSIGPMLLIGNEELDLSMTGAPPITDLAASLDPSAPIVVIDALTGDQQLLWVERDQRGAMAEDQAIIGRVGKNLLNGRRYIVAMRGLKDAEGATLAASTTFAAYRDNTPTGIVPIEARRGQMEEIFTLLESYGITRNDLYLAWDFTTQSAESTSGRLLTMRDDTFDNILGGAAPSFTVDTVTEPLDGNIFRQVEGTFQVPLYLLGGGAPGQPLRVDDEQVPFNTGDFFTANYRCIIPYAATTGGAAPAVPARPSLYGHGLLGTGGETSASHVRAFSSEHNFVMCGTDWTGFAEEDLLIVLAILDNYTFFPNFIDRQHQGILNFQVLGRLMTHANGFASDPAFQVGGQSVIDASELFYDGNSQGGILGGVLAAVSQDIERFVLGVAGINYSTLLNRSIDFSTYGEQLGGAYPSSLDRSILFAAGQILWDRTDPSGHINHVTADPYPGTPAKKLLYQVAFGDHQVAPVTAEIAARTTGALIHTPTLVPAKVVPEVTPYYDIPAIPSDPYDGSALIIYDSGNPAPPIGNVEPVEITNLDPEWADLSDCAKDHDSDPHECPRRQPAARTQKSEFLKTGGAVVDVCSAMACLAPLP